MTISKHARAALLAAASTFALTLASGAQAADAPTGSASTEAGSSGVETVVVTAERRSERLQNVPLSVVALSGSDLSKSGVVGTHDLTEVAPSLNFTSQGSFVEPAIRGVSSEGSQPGNDPNIAIYVDGVYQPIQTANSFALPDVKQVEVLSGPQGTLFGRNATGGAILISTLNPSFTKNIRLSAREGFYDGGGNDTTLTAFVTGPLSDTLAGSLTALYRVSDGYTHDLVHGGKLGLDDDVLLRGKLLWTPWDGVRFLLTGFYTDYHNPAANAAIPINNNSLGRASLKLPVTPYGYQGNIVPNFHQRTYGGNLRGEFDTGLGTLTSITAYTKGSFTDGLQDGDGSPASIIGFDEYAPNTMFSQELNFASRDFGPLSFVSGLYYYDDVSAAQFAVNNAIYLYGKVKTVAWAAFGEAKYKILDDLILTAGLRYSGETLKYGGSIGFAPAVTAPLPSPIAKHSWYSLTPRASLMYKFSDTTNAYFTFSEGFKSGVFDSISFNPVPASPEKIKSYEIGAKSAGAGYSLSAAAFYYDYSNLQVQVFNGVTATTQNAATAEIYGFELNGSLRVDRDVTIASGLAFIPHSTYSSYPQASVYLPLPGGGNYEVQADLSGSRTVKTPRFTFNISPRYLHEFDWGTVSASGSLYYNSGYSFDAIGRVTQPSYVTVNAQLGWTPADSGFEVKLWAKNLTNEALISGTVVDAYGDFGFYSPPREIGLTVSFDD